jgi:hypothetical protein
LLFAKGYPPSPERLTPPETETCPCAFQEAALTDLKEIVEDMRKLNRDIKALERMTLEFRENERADPRMGAGVVVPHTDVEPA